MTPVSRVHANNSEWNLIGKAGIERGMFAMVDEADLFINQLEKAEKIYVLDILSFFSCCLVLTLTLCPCCNDREHCARHYQPYL